MKKFLFLMVSLLVFGNISFAYEMDISVLQSIKDNQIVDFNPNTKVWSRNLGLKDYVFTKHITVGTGSYSEYTYKDKTFDTNTTYEFLYYKKLYGYNKHSMKFFELDFNGEEFVNRELTKEEVQSMFPDVEILMVSEFKDNELEVELPLFHKKAFMLLNDTDMDFYKYQFEYYKGTNNIFNNIFEVNIPRILIYSHFKSRDEMFPILKIIVKPVSPFEPKAKSEEISTPVDTEIKQ